MASQPRSGRSDAPHPPSSSIKAAPCPPAQRCARQHPAPPAAAEAPTCAALKASTVVNQYIGLLFKAVKGAGAVRSQITLAAICNNPPPQQMPGGAIESARRGDRVGGVRGALHMSRSTEWLGSPLSLMAPSSRFVCPTPPPPLRPALRLPYPSERHGCGVCGGHRTPADFAGEPACRDRRRPGQQSAHRLAAV